MTYQKRNGDVITSLRPEVRPLAWYLMYRLSREKAEDVLFTDGYRTKAEQLKEYNEGDSHVKWPYSWHNHGLAIDLVPVLFGQTSIIYKADARYAEIAKEASKCGWTWGFALWGFDKPHFMFTGGKPIKYFIDGGKLDVSKEIKKIQAYYHAEAEQLRNAKKFASGARLKKIEEEIKYVQFLYGTTEAPF